MIHPKCPTCGQPWPTSKGKRQCSLCAAFIRKRHRWFFGIDGRPQHYHCENPTLGPHAPVPAADPTIFTTRVTYLDASGKELPLPEPTIVTVPADLEIDPA